MNTKAKLTKILLKKEQVWIMLCYSFMCIGFLPILNAKSVYFFDSNQYKTPHLNAAQISSVINKSSLKTQKFVKHVDPTTPYNEILSTVDKIHNDTIADFECGEKRTSNLSSTAKVLVEDLGNNPI